MLATDELVTEFRLYRVDEDGSVAVELMRQAEAVDPNVTYHFTDTTAQLNTVHTYWVAATLHDKALYTFYLGQIGQDINTEPPGESKLNTEQKIFLPTIWH